MNRVSGIFRILRPGSIKIRMVGYLAVLYFAASWAVGDWISLAWGLGIVILYALGDVVWTFLRDRKIYIPISSVISGFIIALLLNPRAPFIAVVGVALLAVFCKQVLHFGYHRHVFNPAAFALLSGSLLYSVFFSAPTSFLVSWWGVSWDVFAPLARLFGSPSIFFTLSLWLAVSGGFIVTSIRRWHVVVAFLATFAFLSTFSLVGANVALGDLPFVLKALLGDSTMLFFVTVMLVEPITSQFPKRWQRMAYGIAAAAVAWALGQATFWNIPVDSLMGGLLAANFAASLLFLKRAR